MKFNWIECLMTLKRISHHLLDAPRLGQAGPEGLVLQPDGLQLLLVPPGLVLDLLVVVASLEEEDPS